MIQKLAKNRNVCDTPPMKKVKLTNEAPGRIDHVLPPLLKLSRSAVQKAIKDGLVLVDGKAATPHTAVSAANVVTYDAVVTKPVVTELGAMPKLDVLYEDDSVVVVNKPAGMLSHPAPKTHEHTLADVLIATYPQMADVGDKKERGGLVHRLDREASGVIIAAKTADAFTWLKQQFSERLTKKTYTVLVLGSVKKDLGVIDFPIARSSTGGRMAARPNSQDGREAVTHYDVVERFPHCTLLDVRIETGRTHQIRAHMFAMQHPVAGDTLYTQKGVKQFALGRLFLHARELQIALPGGEEKTFAAPLPKELQTFLNELRERHHK